jgi:hypothetical protein
MKVSVPLPFTRGKYWCIINDDIREGRMHFWIGVQRSKRVTIWPWGRMYEFFIGFAPKIPKQSGRP